MRKVLVVSLLFSFQILRAQAPTVQGQPFPMEKENQRRLEQDSFEKWALDPQASKRTAAAKEQNAASEFYSKAKHFVELWEALAKELNERKTFNAKLAKEVSKAFHDMEKSDGWPVGRAK
jgi:hypothetical protein